MRVWTKQHRAVLEVLRREGAFSGKKAFIEDRFMALAYDWLAANCPDAANRPAHVEYPVWLSLDRAAAMLPTPDTVLLELEVPAEAVQRVNIPKWGAILNYSYIPADEQDGRRHKKELQALGVSDAKAVMTPFYPALKKQIVDSWARLFDEGVDLGGTGAYGIIWEVKAEWIVSVTEG